VSTPAISVSHLWKNFRLYHERNRYIKAAVLRGRRAKYEEFWALQDVSFDVAKGATVGIIGSNGSGKTTLLKCLTGIYFPERGSVTIDGNVAALLELGAGFHPELSGRENVYLNGAILGMAKKEIDRQFDSIVDFAGLDKFIDSPVKNYSSGMVVRLGFSIATHVEPEILLIDEILSVGDAAFQRKSTEKIEQFRRDGRTIVVVSHSLGLVQQLCADVVWLEKGRVRQIGPASEVIAAYTGGTYQESGAPTVGEANRWGTGDVRVSSVTMLDGDGKPTEVVESGATATIVVELAAHVRVESPVVRVMLTTPHGDAVWGTTTQRGAATLRVLEGATTVRLTLPRLPLLEGGYHVSVAVTDATGSTEYDHCERWLRFQVHQSDLSDSGIVAIPSEWSITRH
jgi:ABC-2 type transport system ATP-binding protein